MLIGQNMLRNPKLGYLLIPSICTVLKVKTYFQPAINNAYVACIHIDVCMV
jgi:hypothetical protein